LSEIDQQIVTIQNEFEAELDTLIDAYRSVQQAKKKGEITEPGSQDKGKSLFGQLLYTTSAKANFSRLSINCQLFYVC
jgi:hypothetical protein